MAAIQLSAEAVQIKQACESSLYYLCTSVLGFKDWDIIHDDVEVFLARKSSQKALLLPRNHLKTSIVTIGHVIKRILQNPNIRILIVNQVWDKARDMLFQIKDFLDTKSELPKLYGNFRSDRWNSDDFIINQRTKALKEATVSTTGVEAETTGGHYDLIILDDLIGLQNSQTYEQREKVKRFRRTMFNLLEPGGEIIDLGTRWHLDDVFNDILTKEREYYDIMIRKVVEDGKVIFPKKFNKKFDPVSKSWQYVTYPCLDFVTYLKSTLTTAEFNSQYMNHPIDDESQIFKPSYLKYYERRPENLTVTMTVDLAISQSKDADSSVINVTGMNTNTDLYVLDSVKGKWRPSELIENIFTSYLKWKPSVVGIETNGYQKSLKFFLEERMRQKAIYFPITELKKNTNMSKESRIQALEPFYRDGKVFHQKWMKSLEEELLSFPKGVHDDECFVAGTMIATPTGDRPIETIKAGDLVLTPFGPQNVLASGSVGVRPVIHKYGLVATPNHPIYAKHQFIPLDELTSHLEVSKLSLCNQLKWAYQNLLFSMESDTVLWGRESIISASRVPMLDEKIRKDFMLRFGSFIINAQFKKAFTFIILTATRLITTFQIYSVYQLANMPKSLNDLILEKCEKIWSGFDHLLQNGTQALEGFLGTLAMQETIGKIQESLNWFAFFVKNHFLPLCPMLCTAPSDANKKIEGSQGLTMLTDNVSFAMPISSATNSHTSKHVLSGVVPSLTIETEKKVFNLTVEKYHVYYANGILVSNCDALASQLELLTPASEEERIDVPVGSWEESFQASQRSNMNFRSFFHE